MKRFSSILIAGALLLIVAASGSAQPKSNAAEAAKNWSLFFEYHKNGDHRSAVPYGWNVIKLDPDRFKTVYGKLADSYLNFYQDTTLDKDARRANADTMIIVYDMGIKNVPERASGLWLSRGYALATYFEDRGVEAIASYEKALELDPKTDFVYADQLGILYMKNMDKDPSYKSRAVELYRKQKEADPNNPVIIDRLKSLLTDPQELINLAEQDLQNDPENLEKIWNAAQAYIEAEQYSGAEKHLQKLIKKSPKTYSYWNELGKVQQREEKYRQAIESYEQALKLNPALRENHLNITVCYRMLKNYTAARATAMRAAQRERGWGRPYMEIAEVYKSAVENCIREAKGGDWALMDIDDKLVYRLAQDSFARAKAVEPSLANEANQRMNELSTLVPTKEDLFFHRARIVNGRMEVAGQCYGWVGEQVSVSL